MVAGLPAPGIEPTSVFGNVAPRRWTFMNVRTRKALGCLLLLAYLAFYTALAATVGGYVLAHAPNWASLIYYVIAGIIWVAPLKPLFAWINRAP